MEEEVSRLIEFSLNRQSDLSHVGRRVRLLAALAELPQKQREDLSRAVVDVCRQLLSEGVQGHVVFSLLTKNGQHYLQVEVEEESPPLDQPRTSETVRRPPRPETLPQQALRRLGEIIDEFHLEGQLGAGARAFLRQMLPPTFHVPSETEAALWRRMIQQRSLEDAILVASQRARLAEAKSASLQQQQQLQEQFHGQAEDADSLFSLIASETDNFIVVMDPEGEITWVNNAFVRMTGYTLPEINRRRLDELLGGPSSNKKVLRDLREALRQGHHFNDELLLYRKDGRACWTHFTLTPVRRGNRGVTRWIAIGSDVTQQRQAMAALHAAKEAAEAASQAKSEFLANMSHEIRTPLNAIIGMTELALGTKLTPEQREYLSTVRFSAESLLELLNDILDLSKIEAGKLTIDSVDFNIADLLRDTVKALAVRAHEKNIELSCHVPLDLPQWLRGDPVRLRQILVNLIGNAIKFTEKGEVAVDVEPQWQNNDEICLHFCVRDTGIGISKDRLQKIFEAFEQADTSTTRQFGGTGLGLTITSELLRMMGGKIWVESQPGEGSRFHFSLIFPVVKEPPQRPSVDHTILQGKTVLVVDDNATNRRIIQQVLEHWGMQPTLVDNGPAALELAKTRAAEGKPFDLVILDAMMPHMDGFEVARRLRSDPDIKCGTVLMLSSADRPGSAEKCRQMGIDVFFMKPISPSALLNAVQDAVADIPQAVAEAQAPESDTLPPPERPLHVLIADDHEANRQLAAAILEKRGHTYEFAVDGNAAVQEYKAASRPFDVVLMDVQMPEMDGFAATAAIRRLEKESGRHTPIIALTAHAMKGDREKCLAAGMDAYLAKPLRPRELITLVESVASEVPQQAPAPTQEPSTPAPIDFTYALERLDGEDDLLRMQMQYFLNDGPALIEEIRHGAATGNADIVQRAAHRLKGLLAGYGRSDSSDLCLKVEQDAAEGNTQTAAQLADAIEQDVSAVVEGVKHYLAVAEQ